MRICPVSKDLLGFIRVLEVSVKEPSQPDAELMSQADHLAPLLFDACEALVDLEPNNSHLQWALKKLPGGPLGDMWTGAAKTIILRALELLKGDGLLDALDVERPDRSEDIYDLVHHLHDRHDGIWFWAVWQVAPTAYEIELRNRGQVK